MNPYSIQKVCIACLSLGLWHSAIAQSPVGGLYAQGEDVTGISIETETSPADDSVLAAAPERLRLEFPYAVRLVKLTLRNELRDWVDISFRYDPTVQEEFFWDVPQLNIATYYTADWAILAENDFLVRGSFSFSFGPDAQAPSLTKAAEALLIDTQNGGPDSDVRFVTPPRTNIILNQDKPRYDPPFTIKLEAEEAEQSQDSSTAPR